jgi:hypothetical protein
MRRRVIPARAKKRCASPMCSCSLAHERTHNPKIPENIQVLHGICYASTVGFFSRHFLRLDISRGLAAPKAYISRCRKCQIPAEADPSGTGSGSHPRAELAHAEWEHAYAQLPPRNNNPHFFFSRPQRESVGYSSVHLKRDLSGAGGSNLSGSHRNDD